MIIYGYLTILVMAICAAAVIVAIALSVRRLTALIYLMAATMLIWQAAAILFDNGWMSTMATYIIVSAWLVYFIWLVKRALRLPDAQR